MEQSEGGTARRSAARRGAFFEQRVAQMLHRWLAGRPDEVHVFHDLVGLNNISGAGLKPVSLGGTNIDHLVLTGDGWLMIDAKGCASGSLDRHDPAGTSPRLEEITTLRRGLVSTRSLPPLN